MSKQEIIITYEAPPVPSTRFDWRAGYAGQEEDGKDGHGATPLEALQELLDNYEA